MATATAKTDRPPATVPPDTAPTNVRQAETVTLTVLSVRQPYADHLIHPHPTLGPKWVENRSWTHLPKYRGPLYIHASRWDAKPSEDNQPFYDQSLDDLWRTAGDGVTGAIIGCVDLVASADQWDMEECYYVLSKQSRRKLTEQQQALVPFLPDPQTKDGERAWAWYCGDAALIVANPRALREPILTGGKLGLWKYPVAADRLRFS